MERMDRSSTQHTARADEIAPAPEETTVPVSTSASAPEEETVPARRVAPARRWPRRLGIAFAVLVALALAGVGAFVVYANDAYPAGDEAADALVSTDALPVEQGDGYLAFGDADAATGIVLYPGAKVDYHAYAPLARDLAQRGYFVAVVQMPLNFAFFDIDAADRVRAAFPQVESWWVGGHSLGGSMAAAYAADHADDGALAGVVLLGAYSASDLSATDLGAIVVYGENDQVLNREKLEQGAALLPHDALTLEVPGGNHAGFGDYGAQDGDGVSTITPDEQREQTADAVSAYIAGREG